MFVQNRAESKDGRPAKRLWFGHREKTTAPRGPIEEPWYSLTTSYQRKWINFALSMTYGLDTIYISSHLISSHLYRIGPLLTRARWCFAEQGRIGGAVVRGGASRGDSRPHDGRGVQMRQTGAGTTANTDKIACAGERKSTTYDGWKGGEKKKKKKGEKKKEVSPGLWGLYMCVICVI